MQVKMLVQTQYKDKLLREGKTYDVPEATAIRWDLSRMAEILPVEDLDETLQKK